MSTSYCRFFTFLAVCWIPINVAAQSADQFSALRGWTHTNQYRASNQEIPGMLIDGATITYSSPAVAELDGNQANGLEVAIASEDGFVYVYLANGELLWQEQVPSARCGNPGRGNKTLSTPAIGDLDGDGIASIVIGHGGISSRGCDGGVVAFRADNGSIEWQFSTKQFSESEQFGTRSYTVFSTPALADTDGDGKMEIGFGSFDRNVYLLEYDGSVRWYYNAADTIWSSGAFADINNDGRLEFIIGTDITANRALRPITKNGGYVYAFKTEKRRQKRIGFRDSSAYFWQQTFDQVIFSSPVVADVVAENPGNEVIIASGCYFPENTNNKNGKWIKVLSARSGAVLRTLPVAACSPSSVAVGDIDEDGTLEIVASINGHRAVGGSGRSTLVAFKPQTSTLLWSIIPRERGGNDSYGGHFSSPIIADLDRNGSLEVAVANRAAVGIYSGMAGAALTCQEKDCTNDSLIAYTASTLRGTPTIADINQDGTYELVVGAGNSSVRGRGFLYSWTDFDGFLGSASGNGQPGALPWSTARGSPSRNGVYQSQ
jgi:hypothetical protein